MYLINKIDQQLDEYCDFLNSNIDNGISESKFLEIYDYFIWIDASVVISNKNFINDIIKLLNNNSDRNIFLYYHNVRNNIYDEYIASKNLRKYSNQNMLKQITNYLSEFDVKNLYETGIFIYKNINEIRNLLNDWFFEIMKYSYQCQISIPYVLHKNNINPYILNNDDDVWNNKLFGYVRNHK